VPDDVFLALEHVSGVRSHLAMGMLAGRAGPRLRVRGDRGMYLVEGLDVQEAALRAGERPGGADWGVAPEAAWGVIAAGPEERRVPTEPGRYAEFYAAMVRVLTEDAPVPVSIDDAIAGLEVLEAARRSAEDRAVVALG
jgi:predicted dehydrogenase